MSNLWRESHEAEHYPALAEDLNVDLLIIGGGFTGCSAALEAAKNGASVALLEANTIGHGGSGRNVGLVNAGLWLPPDTIVKTMGKEAGEYLISILARAPDEVFSLIDQHAIECAATRNGTLHLAHAPSGLRDLQNRYSQGKCFGAPLELLDKHETAIRTGSRSFHGALFDPRAGTVQPLAYCRGLAKAANKGGAKVYEYSGVSKLRYNGVYWQAETNGKVIKAEAVLQATNAYGEGLHRECRPQFVEVNYCQYATAPLSDEQCKRILPGKEGTWDTALVMTSIRVDDDGRLIIGGVGDGDGFGAQVHKAWASKKLAKYYPEFKGAQFEHGWSGKIAMTQDHIPKIVSLGPKAFSVFGYSGRGIGPGTVFGKRAARALLFNEVDRLPVVPRKQYDENFTELRGAFYECGSVLTHAVQTLPI
jgi:glycine/D-amino acid oxidase-like deaminating enzyme